MSMTLMVKAMQVKTGSAQRKLVLIKLADNASDSGECWPSYQHIADHCEMDRRTVIRHIKALSEMGMVKIEHRTGEKGNSSNVFRIVIPSDPVTLPSDPVTLPPGDTVSPRTSHSFESVNEPKDMSASTKSDAVPYEKIKASFNKVMSDTEFPLMKVLSSKRKAAIRKFYGWVKKDLGKVEEYFEYFKLNCSQFHKGDNDRGWVANFDYIIREDTFTKASEGAL